MHLHFIYKCIFILVGPCNIREIKNSNKEILLLHCIDLAARVSLGLLPLLSADAV